MQLKGKVQKFLTLGVGLMAVAALTLVGCGGGGASPNNGGGNQNAGAALYNVPLTAVGATGNYKLTTTRTSSGITQSGVTKLNVAKPASQATFCSDSTVHTALTDTIGFMGTLSVTNCIFSGTTGQIDMMIDLGVGAGFTTPGSVSFSYQQNAATGGSVITGQMGGQIIPVTPLDLAGTVSTLAGSGVYGSLDGVGAAASFWNPQGVTSDGVNLFVADAGANKIRKIAIATGAVSTIAGSGTASSLDGTGLAATFNGPHGITTDGNNLYVSEDWGNRIRKIVIATGVVTTLAGSGATGSLDGTGLTATFWYPYGITTDGVNLYVADSGSYKIRKIVIATGVVSTLAGSGANSSLDGIGTAATLRPSSITTDGANLYIGEGTKIRKIVLATGVVTTIAGGGTGVATDGVGSAASFNWITGIATDGSNLYTTDYWSNKIRKIVIATGAVTTLAGSGAQGTLNGVGSASSFYYPTGITTNGTKLFVTDSYNYKVRQIQ